jgi:hypothetical protein
MSRSFSPRSQKSHLLKRAAQLFPLMALAALVACSSSGNSSSSTGQAPLPVTADYFCNPGTFSANPAGGTPPNTFFGMHIHSTEPMTPWPDTEVSTVQFGGLRLWDSGTGWSEINTASGVCSFSHMDQWLTEAQANNVDVLYDLARTPTWASSDGTDNTCAYANISGGNGQCWPPTDLNSDGSGTDAIWIGWVTSVVTRYKGQIRYYEIWNEWNVNAFWKGTVPQLVRMTQDARCVIEGPPASGCNPDSTFKHGTGLDPSAQIVTPAPVGGSTQLAAAATNMNTFLNQTQAGNMGPGNFVDVIGFHCYVSTQTLGPPYPVPENVATVINDLAGVSGVEGKPWFCTEGGWGQASLEGFTDLDLQAAFLARYYLLQTSTPVKRVYWYAWDTTPTDVALWSPNDPTPAAIAYGEVYNWITGATLSSPCAPAAGTVYTCTYTRPNGYAALAVWDSNTAATCYTAGAPTCSTFTIPPQYKLYRDLAGNETDVPGSTIPLSAEPILLETSALP